ncbi:hypothetical protein [Candidatus Venteria ishoeyi]|uniref:Uncharacterized protein n=1 Tax=Candidatus Venteria ishoeyi TaxID=1899563 RepID=A0A1H6F832_9GAMM|nr:hypothetical protein [Candidatus Venteria ishoeyi]MDM8547792.1 hypothetical protein [Candidatus Venteria ishoeyi]SEH05561.1 Uncharacterised protein [Candidatus Venteria ishoeyi]
MNYYIVLVLFVLSPQVLMAADSFKIISSHSTAYQANQTLSADMVITLKSGESLTLQVKGKQRCTLQGPYKKPPYCPNMAQTIAALTPTQRSVNSKQAGLWMIDADQPGVTCYPVGQNLSLWRSKVRQVEQLSIQVQHSGKRISLPWSRGQTTLKWPSQQLPLTAGGSYLLMSAQRATLVSLQAMPDNLSGAGQKSQWMAQQGCQRQLDMIAADPQSKAQLAQ